MFPLPRLAIQQPPTPPHAEALTPTSSPSQSIVAATTFSASLPTASVLPHEVISVLSLSQLITQHLSVWTRPQNLRLSKIVHFYSSHPELASLNTLQRQTLLFAKVHSAFSSVLVTGSASSSLPSQNDVSRLLFTNHRVELSCLFSVS